MKKKKGLVENIVAIDAIAVITSKDNPVNNLTHQQLIDIYKGKIRNWQEVGGNNQPIVVIGREAGSGTRVAFEELLKIEEQCQYANEYNETGPVMAKVGSISGAIGYVSLDVLDESVKALSIDNVEVNQESIQSGKYLLQRPFVMATYGPIENKEKKFKMSFIIFKVQKDKKLYNQ